MFDLTLSQLAFTTIVPFLICAASADPVPVREAFLTKVADIWLGDRHLTAALIESQWSVESRTGLAIPNQHPRFEAGSALISQAEDHVFGIYAERYPERSRTDFFALLKRTAPLFDDRSQILVLFEGTEFKKIVGTLKLSWTNSDHPQLPSASLFPDASLSAGPMKIETRESVKLVTGGVRELKAFTVLNGAGDDLMPILLATAKRMGLFGSNEGYIAFQNSAEAEYLKIQHGIRPAEPYVNGIGTAFRDASTEGFFATPETYYLSCDPKLRPYYTRLGFGPVAVPAAADGSVLMSISSTKMKNWFDGELKQRPGRKLFPEIKFQFQALAVFLSSSGDVKDFPDFALRYSFYVNHPAVRCAKLLSNQIETLESAASK